MAVYLELSPSQRMKSRRSRNGIATELTRTPSNKRSTTSVSGPAPFEPGLPEWAPLGSWLSVVTWADDDAGPTAFCRAWAAHEPGAGMHRMAVNSSGISAQRRLVAERRRLTSRRPTTELRLVPTNAQRRARAAYGPV